MCMPDKYGRPSTYCLLPLAVLCLMLGGGLAGTWTGCYFECLRGKTVEYNYYAAVWTGGLAILSGFLQLVLACFWNRILKYFLVVYNVILVLCCLLCGALYSYVTYLENRDTPEGSSSPSVGVILTGLQAVLAVFILFFVMVWSCVIGCGSLDDQSDAYGDDRPQRRTANNPRGPSHPQGVRGPYEDSFFNREPGIYNAQSQYQERPQEVSYGRTNTSRSADYIIPRASVRGAISQNGYHSQGGTMVVDGRENFMNNREAEPRGYYRDSGRHNRQNEGALRQNEGARRQNEGARRQNEGALQNGVTHQNGTGGRARDFDRHGRGISLMQMHGVAPAANNITDGYY